MDLLYLIAIAVFAGLIAALASGCDTLRRNPGGRP
nr:potassium ABC transporter ATPase [Burkholderia ubonensis]